MENREESEFVTTEDLLRQVLENQLAITIWLSVLHNPLPEEMRLFSNDVTGCSANTRALLAKL